jgi:hypothetical protein
VLTMQHLYQQKLALTSPTSGIRSVGKIRSRTKATEFVCLFLPVYTWKHASTMRGMSWVSLERFRGLRQWYCGAVTASDHRVTAQTASRRFPTAEPPVRFQITLPAICGGQCGIRGGFSLSSSVSLAISIPPTATHSSIIRGWYNRHTRPLHTSPTPLHVLKKRRRGSLHY